MDQASPTTTTTAPRRAAPKSAPKAATAARVDQVLALHRAHYTNLVRLAVLLCDDDTLAVEIVDEVFVRSVQGGRWRRRAPAPVTLADLRAGVVATARRRVSARPPRPADAPVRPVLLDALRDLPHGERECLVLQHYGALSDDDIAAALRAPVADVTARSAAGLAALRRRLDATT